MGFGAVIAQMFSTVTDPALPTIKHDLKLGLSAQCEINASSRFGRQS